jgi:hypothetical protein
MAHPDSRTDALAGGVTAQRNYFDVIFTDTERHVVVLEGAGPFTVLIRELMTYEWTGVVQEDFAITLVVTCVSECFRLRC